MKYQLFTREFVPSKTSLLTRLVSKTLLATTSTSKRKEYRDRFEKELVSCFSDKSLPTVAIETMSTLKQTLPNDFLNKYIDLPFEGGKYQCFSQWDIYLRLKYGNYKKLPPEEERAWKHKPLIIDFNHNYGEES